MYNYFMLIGTLEEDFARHKDKKSTIKVKCNHAPFHYQVIPVNVLRITNLMDDFMYKGDVISIKGRIELDSQGNIELLAERLIMFKKNEESS